MSVLLTADDAATLERVVASHPDPTQQQRARLLLLYDAGLPTREVSEAVGLAPNTVMRWRRRYRAEGLAFIAEMPPPTRDEPAGAAKKPKKAAAKKAGAKKAPSKKETLSGAEKVVAKITRALEDVVGEKRARQLRKMAKKGPLHDVAAELAAHRKSLKKKLKAKDLKAKAARRLKKRLKVLEKQIRRLEKALEKMT